MKKVAILISSLDKGGAERVVSILLEELIKYDIKTTLVLMDSTIKYQLLSSQKIIFLDSKDIKQNSFIKLLKLPYLALKYKKFCLDNDIETSISFMNRPNYINILAKLFGSCVKTVISERIVSSNEYATSSIKDRISVQLIKCLYPQADLILPNSLGIKYDLIKNFSIKENKIKVINNPIDVEKTIELSKEDIDFQNNKFTFITIGRLHPQKNHKLLIEAMEEIDARLYIIGDGILREELSSMIKKLKLEKKVFLLGEQKNPFKYLSKADCFVFGSNYEGFPNVLLEALACGLPVISTDCKSGPREILAPELNENEALDGVEYGKYGVLVKQKSLKDMRTAMKTMINDKSLMENYKLKSYNRANMYDVSVIIKKFIEII